MRFFCNNKLEITIKSRAPSNTGSFFLMLIILMKWTLIFTFLASTGHRFSPAFTQIAPLLLPLGPSCLNVLVGDNCELLDFMLFFSLFYNFNASYPTHTNIYWTKDCSPVVLHEQQSLCEVLLQIVHSKDNRRCTDHTFYDIINKKDLTLSVLQPSYFYLHFSPSVWYPSL